MTMFLLAIRKSVNFAKNALFPLVKSLFIEMESVALKLLIWDS